MSLIQYALAKSGKMFVLTEYGLEQKIPRTMLCNKNGLAKVPKSWVDKGYVVEVSVEE